ncbi:MAG: hypothetical protein GF364_01115 [Candidatus Lokiarchaeota archaeon]|nr:hypothetical protein [Candidatus Lokiarchaeota archaeon]
MVINTENERKFPEKDYQLFEDKDIEGNREYLRRKRRAERLVPRIFAQLRYDVKHISISPDGQYLLCCVCQEEQTTPELYVWSVERTLEAKNLHACEINASCLQAHTYNVKKVKALNDNWILCSDSVISEIDGKRIWIICSGSIVGDLYVWAGFIDERTELWDLKNYAYQNLSLNFNYTSPINILSLKVTETENKDLDFSIYTGISDRNKDLHIDENNEKFHPLYCRRFSIEEGNLGLSIVEGNIRELDGQFKHNRPVGLITYSSESNRLYSGDWSGQILVWDLNNGTNQKLGNHKDEITGLVAINEGRGVISGSRDTVIKKWVFNDKKEEYEVSRTFKSHEYPIVALDAQKSKKLERILISVSELNHLRVWDILNGACTRIINLEDLEIVKYYKNEGQFSINRHEIGQNSVSQLAVSPSNKFVFIVRKNIVILFYRHGLVMDTYTRHFFNQMDYIEEIDPEFYNMVYGENLKQIAMESSADQQTLMREIYRLIKRRMRMATHRDSSAYLQRLLGAIFIPDFVKLEVEENPNLVSEIEKDKVIEQNLTRKKLQKEYIASIRTKYISYWHSVRDMFLELPNESWKFKLYVTTQITLDIKEADWIEITNQAEGNKSIRIPMLDRKQTSIRMLMILDNVPTTLVPLIKSINIDVEDCRGDTATLNFADFTYSKNFLRKTDKNNDGENVYYTDCMFKIDEAYSTEDEGTITLRKITADYEDLLNPLETSKSAQRDQEIFDSFRDNFLYPHIPPFKIIIGKGLWSGIGKLADRFLARLVLIGVIITFTDLIAILANFEFNIPGILIFGLGIVGLVSLIVTIGAMLKKK